MRWLILGGVLAVGVVGWSGGRQGAPATGGGTARDGAQLVAALGCGACHTGVAEDEAIRAATPPLGEGAPMLAPAYIFHYLADPRPVRPDIAPARMPSFDLDERQRLALALFVTNDREMRGVDDALQSAQRRHPETDREEGRGLFEALGCASCHLHPEASPRRVAPDLSTATLRLREEWIERYLADPVPVRPAGPSPGEGGQMPDFALVPDEIAAIVAHLRELGVRAARRDGVQPPPWAPLELSPFAMRKAEALLVDKWSCLGCHQLGDDGGRIGPRLDGVAERLRPEYLRSVITDPAALASGTIMPASLERSDHIDLVASYLLRRGDRWSGVERVVHQAPPIPPEAAPGAELYRGRCAPCHGPAGEGDGFNAPYLPVPPTDHSDSAAMSLRPDDTLYDGVHAGGWILGKSRRMPAFGPSLTDAETRDLVAYIRTLCRCQGPAWSRDGASPG